jgi:hypothetical protein
VWLSDAGSFVVEIANYGTSDSTRVVVMNAQGKVTADLVVASPFPATPDPEGHGVIWQDASSRAKYWSEPEKPAVLLDVWGPQAHVACWVGGHPLFDEWSESGRQYALIDRETGSARWRIPSPKLPSRRNDIAATDGKWLYLYEILRPCDEDYGRHKISVVSPSDGTTLHVWTGDLEATEPARLLDLDGSVWFVTRSEFARLDRDLILAGRQGWARVGE